MLNNNNINISYKLHWSIDKSITLPILKSAMFKEVLAKSKFNVLGNKNIEAISSVDILVL